MSKENKSGMVSLAEKEIASLPSKAREPYYPSISVPAKGFPGLVKKVVKTLKPGETQLKMPVNMRMEAIIIGFHSHKNGESSLTIELRKAAVVGGGAAKEEKKEDK